MPYFDKSQMRVGLLRERERVSFSSSFLVLILHSVLVISCSGLLTLFSLTPLAALGLYTFIPILYLKQKITVCLVFLLYGIDSLRRTNSFIFFSFYFTEYVPSTMNVSSIG